MNIKFASIALAGGFAFALSGCSATPAKTTEAPQPGIGEEARKALAKAEADVEEARAKFALWTTADNALKLAQEAAQAGDNNGVIQQARFVSAQVKGGLAQLSYPSTEQ